MEMPLLLAGSGAQAGGEGGGGVGGQKPALLILPPVIRFLPSDELLLTFYLTNMVAGRPLPRGTPIPLRELYVAGADPWIVQREVAFPYDRGTEFFCFTHRIRRGSGALRTAGTGTWVAKGRDVPIRAKRKGELVGYRVALNFVPKSGSGGEERANWIMHEYRLPEQQGGDPPSSPSLKRKRKGNEKPFQELVVCKIFKHSRSSKTQRGTPTSPEEEEATSATFSA